MKQELENIDTKLWTLKINSKTNRTRRSIDQIGTVWKWIAGNPDRQDFEIVQDKINNLLSNNERQIVINNIINQKLNEVTTNTNKIMKTYEEFNPDNVKTTILLKRIEILKEEINNLINSISWSKAGISNPNMLTKNDMLLFEELIKKIILNMIILNQP